ncbi:hypothetical protein M231_00536 [Tremella mesenterica]|uniref:Exoribonuclease phosphorolytic domain-containing protein n=1 Tax=Tremella mesenterica TaxID=5217 RepID=A0A4Q1BVK8_TREME|nr:hypothetical protein M231_00536 [Tremella mesenterica]
MTSTQRRGVLEYRPISIDLGELDRADGSARFSFGSTSALASSSGPLEVRILKENPTRATLEIIHRPLDSIPSTSSRSFEQSLQSIFSSILQLDKHPRSMIQSVIQSFSPSSFTTISVNSIIDVDPSSKGVWPTPSRDIPDQGVMEGSFHGDTTTGKMREKGKRRSAPVGEGKIFFSDRSVCLNALTLSLLDSGSIGMMALPISINLAFLTLSDVRRSRDLSGRDYGTQDTGEEVLVLVIDPTVEEEIKAISRHIFAWAFGYGYGIAERNKSKDDLQEVHSEHGTKMDGMEVDEVPEGVQEGKGELVWAESEGDFSRSELELALGQGRLAAQKILGVVRRKMIPLLDDLTP